MCRERLGKDRFVVVPHVSSMQLAFARVMETWEEAYLSDLAKHPLDAVLEKIRTAQKVGLFTTDQCGPADVAKALLARRIDYFTAYVCENLGARDERVTRGTLAEIADAEVRSAQRDDPRPRSECAGPAARCGRPPAVRQPGRGVPAIEAEARPVDAGRGACDRARSDGHRPVEHRVGHRRRQRLGEHRSGPDGARGCRVRDRNGRGGPRPHPPKRRTLRRGERKRRVGPCAEACDELPDPDAVFIAGGGREVTRIAEVAYRRLRPGGRLVVNVVSIDHLAELREALGRHSRDIHVWMINLARGTDQLDRLSFDPVKPSFLLAVTKT